MGKKYGLIRLAILVGATFFFGFVSAAPRGEGVHGVWSGTLGTDKITVCFDETPRDRAMTGSFYNARDLVPARLTRSGDGHGWSEIGDGQWTLAATAGGGLKGTRSERRSGKKLPIQLIRVEAAGMDRPCGTDAFNDALERKWLHIQAGPVETSLGKRYRRISLEDTQLVELVDSGKGIAAINKQLRSELCGEGNINESRKYLRESVIERGIYVFDIVRADLADWNERTVTIEMHRQFAGEGAGGAENGYRTFEVATGRELDPWHWLGVTSSPSADHTCPMVSTIGILPPRLKRYLMTSPQLVAECIEQYGDALEARLQLRASGIDFSFGRQPECMNNVGLKFKELQPFLNNEGKRYARWLNGK